MLGWSAPKGGSAAMSRPPAEPAPVCGCPSDVVFSMLVVLTAASMEANVLSRAHACEPMVASHRLLDPSAAIQQPHLST
jgi:hypothetical protein